MVFVVAACDGAGGGCSMCGRLIPPTPSTPAATTPPVGNKAMVLRRFLSTGRLGISGDVAERREVVGLKVPASPVPVAPGVLGCTRLRTEVDHHTNGSTDFPSPSDAVAS